MIIYFRDDARKSHLIKDYDKRGLVDVVYRAACWTRTASLGRR
jgi:hypothetical protein